jgi:hypothetical protein
MIVLAATFLLPAAASATHFLDVEPGADCYGWSADVDVRWRIYPDHVFEGTLTYVVVLKDMDGNELETFEWSGTIDRPEDSYYIQTYSFGEDWTVNQPAGSYMVHGEMTIEAPYSGGVDVRTVTFETDFECDSVPTEETSLTSVKSLFQ